MKSIITSLILTISFVASSQEISWRDWYLESKTDIALLPKYDDNERSEQQKEIDKEFINNILKEEPNARKASDNLINIGFESIMSDVKLAMYRFNQAYLIDSTNSNIYLGYGAIYMTLGNLSKARKQYKEGLKIDPKNTRLLTDYGVYFIGKFYALKSFNNESMLKHLDSAKIYLTKSYNLNPKDPNTVYNLSKLYWNKGDCEKAWKYYNECTELSEKAFSEGYTEDLHAACE